MQSTRRLAAILFTDIVGSTSMMQKDEQVAMSVHKRYAAVLKQSVLSRGGEILNDFGDGSLCTFHSATEALRCAIDIQQQFQLEPKVPLRIGLHVGEIFFEDEKVFGDGVNVASRVQSLGVANSVLFSSEICSKIKNNQEFKSISLGKFHFKNVDEPVEVFALANDGLIVPDRKKIDGKLHKKKLNKKLLLITSCIVLLIALSFFFYYKNKQTISDKEKSIAILPFEIIGNKDDNLAAGLVDDILVRLSKIREFNKVISNKSSSKYKDTKKSLKDIGEELDAIFLVTGNIEQSGNKIRVSAQLIDSRNGNTIWADDYTKQNTEIFDLQTQLATEIVEALKTKMTANEKTGLSKNYTDNIEAYRFYRKGRAFWDQRTKISYDSAEVYYKKAIELDPDYALAYSGIADCYTFNQKGLSQMEAIPVARQYANKALSLDSTLIEARTTIAFIESHYDYKWKHAINLFQQIINDNPNYSIAHIYYSNCLLAMGRNDEALSETKKAISIDPLSAVFNYVLGRHYYYTRRYDSAVSQLQKNIVLNPVFINNYVPLGQTYMQQKLYAKAIEVFFKLPKKPFDLESNGLVLLSYAYASSGDIVTAKNLLNEIPAEDRAQCPVFMAYFYTVTGDYSEAIVQLQHAYDIHAIQIPFLRSDPVFDPLGNDPRFKELMQKIYSN